MIYGKGYFGGEICVFSENHVQLEMKNNSVIGGRICII